MVTVGDGVALSSQIYGADMPGADIASALVGGGSSLVGSLLSYSAAEDANNMNMMMNTGLWKGQQIQNEAGLLGVSPLALLGGNQGGNIPFQNAMSGAAPLLAQAGQNVGRAIAASDPNADRLAKLQIQHAELVNAGLQQDLVGKAAAASVHAAANNALPPPLPIKRLDQRFVDAQGNVTVGRSKDAAESAFSGDPISMLIGMAQTISQQPGSVLDAGPIPAPANPSWAHGLLLRPDFWRALLNTQGATW